MTATAPHRTCDACLGSGRCWVCLGNGKHELPGATFVPCDPCNATGICPHCPSQPRPVSPRT